MSDLLTTCKHANDPDGVTMVCEKCSDESWEELESDFHHELSKLGIPTSRRFPDTACDGSVARIRAYVEDVKAKLGEIDAVPRAEWDRLCREHDSLQHAYLKAVEERNRLRGIVDLARSFVMQTDGPMKDGGDVGEWIRRRDALIAALWDHTDRGA